MDGVGDLYREGSRGRILVNLPTCVVEEFCLSASVIVGTLRFLARSSWVEVATTMLGSTSIHTGFFAFFAVESHVLPGSDHTSGAIVLPSSSVPPFRVVHWYILHMLLPR